jgi:hypothetical protein
LFGDLQSGKVDSPENAQISAARGAPPPVVRFSDDGTKLAALSIRGEVQIWDPAARKIVKKAQMPDGSGTPGLSPDMRRAAITTTQHNIVVWDIDQNKKLQEFAKTKDDSLPGSYLLTNDANSIAFTREKNLERWQLSPPKSEPPDVAPRLLLDQRWKTLDAEDSAAAYQALATLLEKPEQAVQLVRERLEPHGEMNGTRRVERCITLLEWAETPAAVDLLRRFAQCDDRALATPAQAALSRMPQR